ncbi:hypothetical protein FACS1894101_1620 [Betaproteobacteria bacterium]|nr:hypothetical protein FACS1894101_1620 [Betaproteobacteria bacterium]
MNANEITNTAFREARLYGHGAPCPYSPFHSLSPCGRGLGRGGQRFSTELRLHMLNHTPLPPLRGTFSHKGRRG